MDEPVWLHAWPMDEPVWLHTKKLHENGLVTDIATLWKNRPRADSLKIDMEKVANSVNTICGNFGNVQKFVIQLYNKYVEHLHNFNINLWEYFNISKNMLMAKVVLKVSKLISLKKFMFASPTKKLVNCLDYSCSLTTKIKKRPGFQATNYPGRCVLKVIFLIS